MSDKVLPAITQRFAIAILTDGGVTRREIEECLTALGYHGVLVHDVDGSHEHPCPSRRCIEDIGQKGHGITKGEPCCICWIKGE